MAANNPLNALANPNLAQERAEAATAEQPASPPIQLKDFLERTPPGAQALVLAQVAPSNTRNNRSEVKLPEIVLHCGKCSGERKFAGEGTWALRPVGFDQEFVVYRCRNCGVAMKTFAILTFRELDDNVPLKMEKFGEMPPFGPPLSAGVSKLLGSERQYYFKGRRAENQGMGIGAFAYYRRVVEHRKDAIFDAIIRVSEQVDADAALIDELRAAKRETRFTDAVGVVKHAIPQALMIQGHNPLLALHTALSDGLHDRSDEHCLQLAHDIRLVLTEFVERASAALKDDEDLKGALSRLLEAKAKKAEPPA